MTPGCLEALLHYVTANRRVCPMPSAWARLHKLLGPDAPPPLILAAWWHFPPLWKMIRLQAQLRYAAEHGRLDDADHYLRSLRPKEWFTISIERRPEGVTPRGA